MGALGSSIPKKLIDVFSIDLRALGAYRIGLALLIIADLFNRAQALRAHYTDFGVLPRHVALEFVLNKWHISLHMLSGTAIFQSVLFLFALVCALSLLVGYRSRLSMFLTWFLLISLHNRNTLVLQGGDILFGVMCFWALFLPLGARYSVDSALNDSKEPLPVQITSAGTIGCLVQVFYVYFFAFLLKTGTEWRENFTAVYYTLSLDQFVKPLGKFMLNFPIMLKLLTFFTFVFEGLGGFLLFCPFFTGPIRTLTAFVFIGLQMGFHFTLELGLFPFITSVAMIPFLPPWFWDKFRLFPRRVLQIFYDGECSFCKKLVDILKTFLFLNETPSKAAQSDPHIAKIMEEKNSWIVLDERKKKYLRYDAFLQLIEASPIFFPLRGLLSFLWIKKVGTFLYNQVAFNRKLASKLTQHLEYRPVKWRSSWPAQVTALFALLYVFTYNLYSIRAEYATFKHFTIPKQIKAVGTSLRLNQKWAMFAPYPKRGSIWFVIPGKLKNGKEIDVFREEGPVVWDKPELASNMYPTQRWRKYMSNLAKKKFKGRHLQYGRYLCREWNSRHKGGKRLDNFEIYLVVEITLAGPLEEVQERKLLWRHWCFKSAKELEKEIKTEEKEKKKTNKTLTKG